MQWQRSRVEDSTAERPRAASRLLVGTAACLLGGAAAWLLGLTACAAAPRGSAVGRGERPTQRVVSECALMGTTFRIVVHACDPARAAAAIEEAFAAVAAVERWASDWDPKSEVRDLAARAEAAAPGAPLGLSPELSEHLAFALDVAARTGGAFDPTLGTLTRLWRRSARLGELPSAARLAGARATAGHAHVSLDVARREVRIGAPGLRFDLGGSAKGEGLDRALAVLRARGFERALVVGGGDVLVGAPPPGEPGWRVEVLPLGPTGPRLGFTAAECAVSTSGDSEQRFELGGASYAHIVDPATGLGVTARRAATVIAPDGRTADALATALVVRGEAGLALLKAFPGVEGALFSPAAAPAIGSGQAPPGAGQHGGFPACATAGFPEDGGHAAGVPSAATQRR